VTEKAERPVAAESPVSKEAPSPIYEIAVLEYARACRALADMLRLPQTCWCGHHTGKHVWVD